MGGTQNELAIAVNNPAGAGWQVWAATTTVSTVMVGYYPAGDFFPPFQTAAGAYSLGGEAYDAPNTEATPMGNGSNPTAGYGQATYHRDYAACSVALFTGTCAGSQTFSIGVDDPSHGYGFSTVPAAGGAWNNYFYFGSTPNIFWGQNWQFNYSPIVDWASGSYKGECGQAGTVGHALNGISSSTGPQHQAHAIQCQPAEQSTLPGLCNGRSVATTDNRGTNDGDWDIGYVKVECAANEYVQGVAQTTSGAISGLLCCPGLVQHHTCITQIFYGQNSAGYATTNIDWDLAYFKGQCSSP